MPFKAEVGPLILNPSILEEVNELMEMGKCSIIARIESTNEV